MARRRQATRAAEVAYADVPARQIKMLGSLPVIASFCRRLDISGVIDDLVPIRDVATVSTGQAIEAMVCNRLTSPAPLVHTGDWARTWDLGFLGRQQGMRGQGRFLPALQGHHRLHNFGFDG